MYIEGCLEIGGWIRGLKKLHKICWSAAPDYACAIMPVGRTIDFLSSSLVCIADKLGTGKKLVN